jgi:hypothetical protein
MSLRILSNIVIQPFRPILRFFDPTMRTVAVAAADIVKLATNEASPDERGYFSLLEKEDSSPDSLNRESQEQLWRKTLEWTGLVNSSPV